MGKPALEVADIFRLHGLAYREVHDGVMSSMQRRVMRSIEICRTAVLGGHVEECGRCGYRRIRYNSCGNRHCNKCQCLARAKWLEKHRGQLLPVPYFHVVFTVPGPIASVVLQNKRVGYSILFQAAARALRRIAADPKHLGAKIGFLAVLHSWGKTCNIIRISTASCPAAACRWTAAAGSAVAPTSFFQYASFPAFFERYSSIACNRPMPRESSNSAVPWSGSALQAPLRL